MVAEESLQKNAAKIVTLEAQLNLANSKMEKIQDLIDQQKGMNEDLKKEYNKLNEVKIDLETRLQSVLKAQSTQEPVAGVAPLQEPVEVSK